MSELLFIKHDLSMTIRAYEQKFIPNDVKAISENELLSTSEHQLVSKVAKKYKLDVPRILHEQIYVKDHGEASRAVSDFGRQIQVTEDYVVLGIPFHGDGDLFHFRGNKWGTNPPRAVVLGDEIELRIQNRKLTKDIVDNAQNSAIDCIETYLEYLRADCEKWNARSLEIIHSALASRKDRILKKNDLVESLGLPIGARAKASGTIVVPIKQKTISVPRQSTALRSAEFKPEPAIDEGVFDSILEIIERMSINIERSPTIFLEAGEESIRDMILVNLNGHFEGSAAGETFNRQGKTDILIRAGDRNVFIAECKIWRGPKSLNGALDQLLSYLTWRDTKASIILFSRVNNFSAVLSQIDDLVCEHECFRKALPKRGETHFRYVLKQPQDERRDIHLAVLVFDLPNPNKEILA